MHIPADVAALAGQPGPFATVYIDVTRASENAAKEIELRTRWAREQLEAAGADEATVAAATEALGAHVHEDSGSRGRCVVARAGEVVLDRMLPRPPVRDVARWAPLPHLMPLFAQAGPSVPHVVVVADRTGADVHVVTADDAISGAAGSTEQVQGSDQYPIRKTGRDVWGEDHFQHRVENDWEGNAHDVAQDVAQRVRESHAEVVAVAGDERARALIVTALAETLPQGVDVADLEVGGRAEGSSVEALDAAVQDVVLRGVWRSRHHVLGQLRQGLGRGDVGVAGVEPVLEALRRAQVETLVLSDDPSSTLQVWIGPEPLLLATDRADLEALGVQEPVQDRLDAAVVRALAGSSADVVVTPDGHRYLPEGIGAVLRYSDPSTAGA